MLPLRRSHTTAPSHLRHHIRNFINARIPWFRDPYLDAAVEREKDLKPLLSLKNLIAYQPSQTMPLSTISPLKPQLRLPTTALKFIQEYPLIFKIFLPPHTSIRLPHVKLTPRALSLHHDEILILNMSHYRRDVAERLAKILMLTGAGKLPLYFIDMLKHDLGMPHDYLMTLLPEFPDFFQICNMGFRDSTGGVVFGLEMVSWKDDLAVSVLEKMARKDRGGDMRTKFSMNFPSGLNLEKRVMEWLEEWHNLPYISPYENAFHLAPNGDQAEKWAVGVLHELMSLTVSKKIEREILFCLAEFWGFGQVRFKKALVHFPGLFYVSNKISTQTVVLREAFRKNMLIEKHQLMGMRTQYIFRMNLVLRRGKPIGGLGFRTKRRVSSKGSKKKVDYKEVMMMRISMMVL